MFAVYVLYLKRAIILKSLIMSNSPPKLFDEQIYFTRLQRAKRLGFVDFLVRRANDELHERLAHILRKFDVVADIGTPLLLNAELHKGIEFLYVPPQNSDQALPLKSNHYALITSLMALHCVNDLPGIFTQIRRALRPDGLFMACIPAGKTLHELRNVLQIAESEITNGVSPRIFPFAEIKDFGSLLQRANFTLPVTDSESVVVRYDNMFALMRDLRAMAATNILSNRLKHPTRKAVFQRAAELYQEQFSDSDGRIRATFEFIWVSGWAAHESQQKPLKPGSAKQKLADALVKISQDII
jgi:SAM-dependent methyltransferase